MKNPKSLGQFKSVVDSLAPSKFITLDPKKVAVTLEKMICQRKEKMTLPGWLMPALRLRYR